MHARTIEKQEMKGDMNGTLATGMLAKQIDFLRAPITGSHTDS